MPSTWLEWAQFVQAVASVGAITIGASWVLFNTTWARTFRARLQVRVDAEDQLVGTVRVIRVRMQIENKGVSKVDIERSRPILTVCYMPRLSTPSVPRLLKFDRCIDHDVFETHYSVEPGLMITEEVFVRLPQQMTDACAFRFTVVAHGMRWSASAVLPKATKV